MLLTNLIKAIAHYSATRTVWYDVDGTLMKNKHTPTQLGQYLIEQKTPINICSVTHHWTKEILNALGFNVVQVKVPDVETLVSEGTGWVDDASIKLLDNVQDVLVDDEYFTNGVLLRVTRD